MRALLAGELAQAQSWESEYYIKLEVKNASGTWIDVGALLGTHWIVNATWGEHRDTQVSSATFTLIRNIGTASLAPLMTGSALNVDDAMAYAPLLNVGRSCRASSATMAYGVALDAAKYRLIFTGRLDDVFVQDDGEGRANIITLPCSDLGGWLMDIQIETSGTQYGDPVTPPALEAVLQAVINGNIPVGEPAVALVKQSASSFGVTDYRQGDTKLLEGLITLVLDSTGEDIRYRFDAAHVSQLMWFNPDRSRVTVDATFTALQYVMRRVDLSLRDIRNAGALAYTASGVSGVVTAEDAPSIADYRRRWFRLPFSKMLASEAEAQTVIDTVVNDLSGPPAEAQAELPYCWFVQLYDRYTFAANGKTYDQDQTFAVGGYQHTIENSRGSTVLTPLTARIVGAYAAWQRRIQGAVAQPDPPVLSASFDATGQLIINSSGDFATGSQKIAWATGAAPSAATVRATTAIAQQNVSGLATGSVYPAGTTVYIAAFAYSANGLESTPLASISVTREGSGTSAPPVATIVPLDTEVDDTVWNLRFAATAGSGGGGTNLTYDIRQKIGFAAETSLASGNATTLPRDLGIARHVRSSKVIRLIVTDTATGLSNVARVSVPSRRNEIDDTARFKRGNPHDDGDYSVRGTTATGDTAHSGVKESGGKAVNRLIGKALAGDADSLDGLPEGTTYNRPLASRISAGKPFIDFAEAFNLNKNLGNVADTSARFAAPVPNATSDAVLIASAGIALGGNSAARTASPDDWDQQVYSKEGHTGGAYAQATLATPGAANVMFGLNTDPTLDAQHISLDYAFYQHAVGSALYIYESGTQVGPFGTWAVGDVLAVTYDGSNVRYLQNGTVLRTVAAGPSIKFFFDSSFYTLGVRLDNIRFGPMSSNNAAAVGAGNFIAGINESGGKAVNRLYGKALAGDADTAESVIDGTSKRVIPFSILRASDGGLLTLVDYTAKVGEVNAGVLAKRAGIFFSEAFDAVPNPASNWSLDSGGAATLVGGVASVGQNVAQFAVLSTKMMYTKWLPFNPSKLYRIRIRVRQTVDGTGASAPIYIGIAGADASGVFTNAAFGQAYCAAAAYNLTVAQGWVEFTGWVKGASLPYASGTPGYSSDPTAPIAMNVNTVQIRPFFHVNWNSTGAPVAQFDYFQIEEFDEDASSRTYNALELSSALKSTTQQRNGTGLKNVANGRYTTGTGVHGASITYPTNYQNPPAINILGGISYQPASLWGTAANADAVPQTGAAAPSANAQIDEVVAYNVTTSGASLRARLRQASAGTNRTDAYATGTITTNGGTKEATTANAPAANDTYTSDYTVQFTSTAVPGKSCSVSGTVCLDYWNGSAWIQVASSTYAADDPVNGAADTGLISDVLVATVSGLTGSSKFRVRLVTNAGAGTRTYMVDPVNVAYTTTTGDQYTSKTPANLGIALSVEVIGAS